MTPLAGAAARGAKGERVDERSDGRQLALEESAGLVQQIVIDPEGDFVTLADAFGRNNGGYIGGGEIGADVPLANAEAMLRTFAGYTYPRA